MLVWKNEARKKPRESIFSQWSKPAVPLRHSLLSRTNTRHTIYAAIYYVLLYTDTHEDMV